MKRIIPVFLLRGSRLVKGTQFTDFVDVGDPISQGMIYDAQGADEITIVDITANSENRTINPNIINEMIKKCRLPIAAGGGIKKIEDAKKCFRAGADKIVVNSSAVLNPSFIKKLALEFGSQSVLVSLDIKKDHDQYAVFIKSGRKKINIKLEDVIEQTVKNGAGEIVVTVIDKEGTLSGMDVDLYKRIRKLIPIPLIASGGAGCYDDLVDIFQKTNIDACGIGKMLFLRDYDIVRIKSYLKGKNIALRES